MPVLKRPKKTSGTKIVRAEFSMGRAPRRVSDFEITVDHMGRKSLKAHAPPKDHTGKLRGIMIALAVLIILAAAFVFVLVYTEFKEAAKSPPGSAQEVIGSDLGTVSQIEEEDDRSKYLLLVGLHSELDAAYAPELTEYEGISGEKTAVAALEELMSAAKEAGVPLYVTRGYVSRSEQDALFEERVRTLMEEGYTRVRAEATAQETVAPGGMDEHQTGLAFDFWQEGLDADGDFTNSQAYNWLVKNCVEYGFVLRYAANKEDETYMPYDPTHFRFVGRENARAMRTLDMCLEEYAAYVGKQDGR